MDHSKDAAVRARAYQLWVENGYADGYQDQHWRQAEREIDERSAATAYRYGEIAGTPIQTSALTEAWHHSDGMSHHPSVIDPAPMR